MDSADRNYIESLILNARRATKNARDVAEAYGLADVTERLTWAIEFQDAAAVKLGVREPNADGTHGPEHVTSEGVELRPDDVCQCGLTRSEHTGSLGGTFLERPSQ